MKTGPEGPVFEGGEVLLLLARMDLRADFSGLAASLGDPG
jgi:hypothetical protein